MVGVLSLDSDFVSIEFLCGLSDFLNRFFCWLVRYPFKMVAYFFDTQCHIDNSLSFAKPRSMPSLSAWPGSSVFYFIFKVGVINAFVSSVIVASSSSWLTKQLPVIVPTDIFKHLFFFSGYMAQPAVNSCRSFLARARMRNKFCYRVSATIEQNPR